MEHMYMLDYIILGIGVVLLFLIGTFGPRMAMNKYFIKYVLLAEQIYFEPKDGKTRYQFVMDHITQEIGKKSFLLRKVFEMALDEKTVRRYIDKTIASQQGELDLIKQSNNTIASTTAKLITDQVLQNIPNKPETAEVADVVRQIQKKSNEADNTLSAFAEVRTDFRHDTEMRAGAAISMKL